MTFSGSRPFSHFPGHGFADILSCSSRLDGDLVAHLPQLPGAGPFHFTNKLGRSQHAAPAENELPWLQRPFASPASAMMASVSCPDGRHSPRRAERCAIKRTVPCFWPGRGVAVFWQPGRDWMASDVDDRNLRTLCCRRYWSPEIDGYVLGG